MSRNVDTFYWYDYETFGTNPALDRPSQFAGLRTDLDLNPVGESLVIYNRLTDDYLPDPFACKVTGISPDTVSQHGLPERDFIAAIQAQISQSGTCNVGYNSIRFDDEFSRYTLFRNFYDPYEHEWKNGNSRWDLLDIVRLVRALRPDGIEWPSHDDGKPSNRLEHLTAANGLSHENAHDALSDVIATIDVARMIKERKPQLFDYAFANRKKQQCAEYLNKHRHQALLHVSGMYPGQHGHLAVITPVAQHPTNKSGVVVFDLRYDPEELVELGQRPGDDGASEIARRLFTRNDDLPEGQTRLPLKTVHVNRSPVLVPLGTLDDASAERLGIDKKACLLNLERLNASPSPGNAVALALTQQNFNPPTDTDATLYSGGFFSNDDRDRFANVRRADAKTLASMAGIFDDDRGDEMLFRYHARNLPDSLDEDQQQQWHEHCQQILLSEQSGSPRTLESYRETLATMEWTDTEQDLLNSLRTYGDSLEKKYLG